MDVLFITEIYPAGEEPIDGITGERLVEKINIEGTCSATFIGEPLEAMDEVIHVLKDGDILLTMGAGDIWRYSDKYLHQLKSNQIEI